MHKLEPYECAVLGPFIARVAQESQFPENTNVDQSLSNLHAGIERGDYAAFVDDIGMPRLFVIGRAAPSGLKDEKILWIMSIYADAEVRNMANAQILWETIRDWGKQQGCTVVKASSWEYEERLAIRYFWEALGFRKEEVVFTKQLK